MYNAPLLPRSVRRSSRGAHGLPVALALSLSLSLPVSLALSLFAGHVC